MTYECYLGARVTLVPLQEHSIKDKRTHCQKHAPKTSPIHRCMTASCRNRSEVQSCFYKKQLVNISEEYQLWPNTQNQTWQQCITSTNPPKLEQKHRSQREGQPSVGVQWAMTSSNSTFTSVNFVLGFVLTNWTMCTMCTMWLCTVMCFHFV